MPNPWQGSLRFGRLDLNILGDVIRADLSDAAGGPVCVRPRLALTCLDQIDEAAWIEGGREHTDSAEALAARIAAIGLGEAPPIRGFGPTRATLQGLEASARA